MENTPLCFDDWEQALRTSVPEDRRHAYREAIVKFRYWLRETGKLPDAETFREHLEWKKSYLTPDRFEIRDARRICIANITLPQSSPPNRLYIEAVLSRA